MIRIFTPILLVTLVTSGPVQYNDSKSTKTLLITGVLKYQPGGSKMIANVVIEGDPGFIPTTGSTSGVKGTPTGSVSSTSSVGGYEGNAFEKEALARHNKFRQVHGSQPMKLNKRMCEQAAAYARISANAKLEHSSKEERRGEGENLSMGCSSTAGQTIKEAVTNWYNEVCTPGYNFDEGRGQGGTGHFTQVVWNDSVELGIGKADAIKNGMKCTFFVGRYKPLGNFNTGNDDYKTNVKKGSFDSQTYCASIQSQFDEVSPHVEKEVLKRNQDERVEVFKRKIQ